MPSDLTRSEPVEIGMRETPAPAGTDNTLHDRISAVENVLQQVEGPLRQLADTGAAFAPPELHDRIVAVEQAIDRWSPILGKLVQIGEAIAQQTQGQGIEHLFEVAAHQILGVTVVPKEIPHDPNAPRGA